MASIRTKFTVGLFLAAGLALTVVAIIWLGVSHYFDKGERYLAYFDDSVQGLAKDSPVKYRGVPVGRVEQIGVAPDAKLIEVVIMFDQGLKPDEHMHRLVAQLKTIGITGIMFIELDQKNKSEPNLSPRLSFQPEYPVVATKPSEITKLLEGFDDVIKQFQSLNLKEISRKIKITLDKFNQVADDAKIKDISADIRSALGKISDTMDVASSLNALMENANSAIKKFDGLVSRNEPGVNASVDNFITAVKSADSAIARFDGILADNQQGIQEFLQGLQRSSNNVDRLVQDGTGLIKNFDGKLTELQLHLTVMAKNLKTASENLNNLIEIVTDQPSQLIFGEPAPERTFTSDKSE